jgi:hypothetical protein
MNFRPSTIYAFAVYLCSLDNILLTAADSCMLNRSESGPTTASSETFLCEELGGGFVRDDPSSNIYLTTGEEGGGGDLEGDCVPMLGLNAESICSLPSDIHRL